MIPGVIVTLLIGQVAEQAPVYLLPIAAGGFIHIAACDFLPALHQGEVPRRAAPRASVGQIASVILGVAAVTA